MPKVPHGIPKPLTVAKAAAVVDGGAAAELDWVAARDTAVLLLLYGCGLRISEALSLLRKDAPLAGRDVLRIVGKGGKERLVPVLPVTQAAIARYIALCPYPLDAGRPAVPRRQGRPPEPAHRPAAHGAPARRAGPARHGNAARAAPLLRHAPALRRRRPAPDPGAARPRQPVDHPGSTPRSTAPACSPSTTRPTRARRLASAGSCTRVAIHGAVVQGSVMTTGSDPLLSHAFHQGSSSCQNPPSSSAPAPASAQPSPGRCTATATRSRSPPATRTSSPASPRRPAPSSIAADATKADAVKALFAEVDRALGPLDVVLFNASFRTRGPFLDLDPTTSPRRSRSRPSPASSSARRRRGAWWRRAGARSSSPAPPPA